MSKKRFSEIFEQNRSNFGVLANLRPNNYGNPWRGSILAKNAKTGFRLGMDDEKELGGGNDQSGLNPALNSIIRKFSKKPGRTKLLDLATWMFNYYVRIVNLILTPTLSAHTSRPYGFEIDFVRNPISRSAAWFFVIILKLILTAMICCKSEFMKKIPTAWELKRYFYIS